MCPRVESNHDLFLRREVSYPLNYGDGKIEIYLLGLSGIPARRSYASSVAGGEPAFPPSGDVSPARTTDIVQSGGYPLYDEDVCTRWRLFRITKTLSHIVTERQTDCITEEFIS